MKRINQINEETMQRIAVPGFLSQVTVSRTQVPNSGLQTQNLIGLHDILKPISKFKNKLSELFLGSAWAHNFFLVQNLNYSWVQPGPTLLDFWAQGPCWAQPGPISEKKIEEQHTFIHEISKSPPNMLKRVLI